MSKKVGLLLPRSAIYPTMSFDLMGGLKWALESCGITDVEIKTEGIGIAADGKLIYTMCEKLIFDGCEIVAGYVNPVTAEQLKPLFEGANALFIALDGGYQYPASLTAMPNVITLSFQGTLCCRIAGATAVAEGCRNMAFTGSFYDAGFRGIHALARGLEDAGGAITFNHITKLKRSEFTLEPLAQHLKEHATDGVLAAFCGDMLQDFFAGASAENLFENHAVYGSPFVGDEVWLAQSAYPGVDIKTFVTWASGLDNTANLQFKQKMAEKKLRYNIFSVLGWEAGQITAAALGAEDIDDRIRILEGLKYTSPRGEVVIDAATHNCDAPVYEAWIKRDEATGNCILIPVKESPLSDDQRQKLYEDIRNFAGPATSWQNAYGCLDD